MKHKIKIIFGKEQVNKFYNNEIFTKEEEQINIKEFLFNSEVEKDAFYLGLNEAIGWTEYCLMKEAVCEYQ